MNDSKARILRKALVAAFPHTIPIFAGFWFLGLTYGVYMNASGFSFWYPMFISLTVFAGSMEFIAVNLLLGAFHPLQALMLTLMVNARHLFYGISMLERYKHTGWKKPYLIFGLCDETFSINYTAKIPENVDKGWFFFFVTLTSTTSPGTANGTNSTVPSTLARAFPSAATDSIRTFSSMMFCFFLDIFRVLLFQAVAVFEQRL